MSDLQGTRTAVVRGARSINEVSAYLPDNYRVVTSHELNGRLEVIVRGYDKQGWTLDGYVIPRLASGLIFATETL